MTLWDPFHPLLFCQDQPCSTEVRLWASPHPTLALFVLLIAVSFEENLIMFSRYFWLSVSLQEFPALRFLIGMYILIPVAQALTLGWPAGQLMPWKMYSLQCYVRYWKRAVVLQAEVERKKLKKTRKLCGRWYQWRPSKPSQSNMPAKSRATWKIWWFSMNK